MNWKIKNAMYHIMETIPLGAKVYSLIQEHITKSVWVNDDQFLNRYYDSKVYRHVKAIKNYGKYELKDSTMYEFGAGWDLMAPVGFSLCWGIKRFIAVDLNVYLHSKLLINTLNLYQRNKEILIKDYAYEIDDNLISKDINRVLKDQLRIDYKAPVDARNTFLEDESIEYIISNVTLEHIPPEDIISILKECYRILKKDGLMTMTIDYTDHYAHTDSNISLFNYLKYNENEWKKYNTGMHYQNRLQHSDYREIIIQSGFEIVDENVHLIKEDIATVEAIDVADCFKKYESEELACREGFFVVRKNDL